MERVIVLGLSGCRHCDSLVVSLTQEGIPFEFKDADLKEHSKLADRMEALLKTDAYPMLIIERPEGAIYLHRVDTINEAKESPLGFATKVGCVTTDSRVAITKKYIKK
jgi:glutaredoxin